MLLSCAFYPAIYAIGQLLRGVCNPSGLRSHFPSRGISWAIDNPMYMWLLRQLRC